jgi:hypothetical protein
MTHTFRNEVSLLTKETPYKGFPYSVFYHDSLRLQRTENTWTLEVSMYFLIDAIEPRNKTVKALSVSEETNSGPPELTFSSRDV